ncbi:MAG: hypothetical protein WB792_17245, partial [Desulfobacterales bacterium]
SRRGRLDPRCKAFNIEHESEDTREDNKRDDTHCYEQNLFLMDSHILAPLDRFSSAVAASSRFDLEADTDWQAPPDW